MNEIFDVIGLGIYHSCKQCHETRFRSLFVAQEIMTPSCLFNGLSLMKLNNAHPI